ncbi:MAG: endonuclease/exonuclease/phosphatase family protein [Candidatus Omnitrophica bacterium]|nr:endonuclease/exonuclease/phosphatase family protein [Candidatus Omnitrophota bacterium]MCB9719319.1 endonuclease/exonuclease/phosphatase family protein [Candidatus Omnitrophota bacterium]
MPRRPKPKSSRLTDALLLLALIAAIGLAFAPRADIERFLEQRTASAPAPVTAMAGGDDLRVCSFNIRVFSNKSRDDNELDYITNLLEPCDITAIQELRDEDVLRRTVALLERRGYPAAYDISAPVGRGVKERYAFLYRADKVAQTTPGQLYPDERDEFIREPYFASFRAGAFDFTLLTIHLLYGKSESERRPELEHLAKVYEYAQNADAGEQDIILLGDFNFGPDDRGWSNLNRLPTMTALLNDPVRTTVTDTSLYDNFWFETRYVREYTGQVGVWNFDETMFGNDDNRAKLAVSDHRPIWALFSTTEDDD